jgi:hypothetical protein
MCRIIRVTGKVLGAAVHASRAQDWKNTEQLYDEPTLEIWPNGATTAGIGLQELLFEAAIGQRLHGPQRSATAGACSRPRSDEASRRA